MVVTVAVRPETPDGTVVRNGVAVTILDRYGNPVNTAQYEDLNLQDECLSTAAIPDKPERPEIATVPDPYVDIYCPPLVESSPYSVRMPTEFYPFKAEYRPAFYSNREFKLTGLDLLVQPEVQELSTVFSRGPGSVSKVEQLLLLDLCWTHVEARFRDGVEDGVAAVFRATLKFT